ncbi:unnamed protein product [Urochloa decumbens]|uniref:Zinc finger GRF-type domain-containing protein n=1 Tax=Urochloa decumbens TaxID=240449 RepID=A0ABC8YTR7_9POAL
MRTVSTSTASASGGKQLPLVECPSCGIPVIKIRSKQKETYGELFFKCPNNIKEDSRTCGFIRSEGQYEFYVRGLEKKDRGLEKKDEDEGHHFGDGNDVLRWQWFELKQEVGMMKQQVDTAAVEIGNLKMQIYELKEQKAAFLMSISVAVAGLVGLLVGLLVRAMWK